MIARTDASGLQQQALDFVFARLGGDSLAEPPPSDDPATDPSPLPVVTSADDLKAAAEWLHRERQRLQAYTQAQLARIQEDRQALSQQHYLNEQTLIFRSQELAHREEMLLAQGRSVQQQAQELAQREQALAARSQQWPAGDSPTTAPDHRQQSLLEAMQRETLAARRAREEALLEATSIQTSAEEIRSSRAREEASLKARQEQLEHRLLAADHALLAATQQQAELDDLEARLRRETEEQDRELARARKTLVAMEERLRGERQELATLQADLEQRHQRLQEAQATLLREQGELAVWFQQAEDAHAEIDRRDEDVCRRAAEVLDLEKQLREAWELRTSQADTHHDWRPRAATAHGPLTNRHETQTGK